MSFSVEYILMEHKLLGPVFGTSEVMILTIIEADTIWVVKGEISMRIRGELLERDRQTAMGYYLQVFEYL